MTDTALTVIETGVRVSPMDTLALMSNNEFAARLNALKLAQQRAQIIQREIMDADIDYGVIPGTGSKPTLLKPGAEKLCKFHHLVPTFNQVTILGDGITLPHIRVLTTCSLHYETEDGPVVAQGVGAANSWEKKYRYRDGQRRCPHCQAAAIFRSKHPDRKTGELGWYCWDKRGGCGATFGPNDPAIVGQQTGQIENPDPFDGENTLDKMSAKRSQTDATLRATATSGLWSQDLEDMAEAPAASNVQMEPMQTAEPQAPRPPGPAQPAPRTPARAPQPPPNLDEPTCKFCGAAILEARIPQPDGRVMLIRREKMMEDSMRFLGAPHCHEHYQSERTRRKALIESWATIFDRAHVLGIEPGVLNESWNLPEIEAHIAEAVQAIEAAEAQMPVVVGPEVTF